MSTMTVRAPVVRPAPRRSAKHAVAAPRTPVVEALPPVVATALPVVRPAAAQPAVARAVPLPVTITASARAWAVLAHLSGLVAGAAGPYLVYRFAGPASPYVREQAAEAVRFQLIVLAVQVGLVPLALLTAGFAVLLAVPLALGGVLLVVSAGSAAAGGEKYRYPVHLPTGDH
jgi:uncharacterized Tic20 family protein